MTSFTKRSGTSFTLLTSDFLPSDLKSIEGRANMASALVQQGFCNHFCFNGLHLKTLVNKGAAPAD